MVIRLNVKKKRFAGKQKPEEQQFRPAYDRLGNPQYSRLIRTRKEAERKREEALVAFNECIKTKKTYVSDPKYVESVFAFRFLIETELDMDKIVADCIEFSKAQRKNRIVRMIKYDSSKTGGKNESPKVRLLVWPNGRATIMYLGYCTDKEQALSRCESAIESLKRSTCEKMKITEFVLIHCMASIRCGFKLNLMKLQQKVMSNLNPMFQVNYDALDPVPNSPLLITIRSNNDPKSTSKKIRLVSIDLDFPCELKLKVTPYGHVTVYGCKSKTQVDNVLEFFAAYFFACRTTPL